MSKRFNVDSITDPKLRQSVRDLLERAQDNANESARFRHQQAGELLRIERRYNVIAHSQRAYWQAIREAMQ